MLSKMIRLSRSSVGEEERLAIARVIESGYLGMGAEVQAFEAEIQTYLETDRDIICVNTGTAALHLAVACLDIGPGDEVLVPSLTYVASFQAISATGATPVACDVTRERGFIDVNDAEQRLTERTRAIMPVHYASNSDGIDDVYAFAKHHGLRVIEDAAHAFGCEHSGVKVGGAGDVDVICFSFDGIKNITSGEGGAVVTGDGNLAARIRDARLLGVERDTEKRYRGERSWDFDVRHQGFRYHMSNLMAAVGREQLKKLGRFARHRRRCALRYVDAFADLRGLRLLRFDYSRLVPHIFPVEILEGRRDALMNHLRADGIESGVHYKPNHFLAHFHTHYSLPISERFGASLLSLPLHAELIDHEQDRVIASVQDFLGDSGA